MKTVTIDRFGRVLIPKRFRERLGLTPGHEFEIEVESDGIKLKATQATNVIVREGKALVFDVKGQDDIRAAIEGQRAERDKSMLFDRYND